MWRTLAAAVLAPHFPHLATLAAELSIGALLLVDGVVWAALLFRAERTGEVVVSIITGGLSVVTGALLLTFPLGGILPRATVLAAFFQAIGGVEN